MIEDFLEGKSDNLLDSLFTPRDVFPPVRKWMSDELARKQAVDSESRYAMKAIHLSSASKTQCGNFHFLHYHHGNGKTSFSPNTLMIFENGNYTHTRIQTLLKPRLLGTWKCEGCGRIHHENSAYKTFVEEVAKIDFFVDHLMVYSLSEEPMPMPEECVCGSRDFSYIEWRVIDLENFISSRCDGVIEHEGVKWVLEIKSCNNNFFNEFSKTGLYHSYVRQLGSYMKILGIQKGLMLLENKNDQQAKVIPYDMDTFYSDPSFYHTWETIKEAAGAIRKGEELFPKKIAACEQCVFYNKECKPT